ncbi:MAG: hypothetical protein RIR97_1945 [Pseudomonadota bacterium]
MAETIDCLDEPDEALSAAVDWLSAGVPVAIPTETVYGLAADATNADAIAKIYEIKGRPLHNPLICHMSDIAMAESHVIFDPVALLLARTFWPGPLTLVLPRHDDSPIDPAAGAGLPTLAVRVPEGFARTLITRFGKPLAAPSANRSGAISPTTAAHVEADLGEKLALIIDGGACSVGVESTILLSEAGQLTLLRPGGITVEDIERVSGQTVLRRGATGGPLLAPGMMASHYAPETPMRLEATHVEAGEVLITFGGKMVQGQTFAEAIFDLSPAGHLDEAATHLFDILKQADAAGGKGIAVCPIPAAGIGEAINDRLMRAAAPKG